MCGPILLMLVGLPVAEFYGIAAVGERIGGGNTLLLLILDFFVGVNVLRGQSLAAVRRLQAGVPPAPEVLGGPLLFVAALLLMFPGFVSDAVALPLLVPPIRRFAARRLARRLGGGQVVFTQFGGGGGFSGGVHFGGMPRGAPGAGAARRDAPGDVIDVTAEEVVVRTESTPRRLGADDGSQG